MCADELRDWNKKHFEVVGEEIKKLKGLVQVQWDALNHKEMLT